MTHKNGRILSIDFGEKRIGFAISDPLGITAQPLSVLTRTHLDEDIRKIQSLVAQYDVDQIVMGLPLNMDGSEGFMVKAIRAFCAELIKVCPLDIVEIDERLTSRQAQQNLIRAEIKGRKKKKILDSLAAQILLQTYLDSMDK